MDTFNIVLIAILLAFIVIGVVCGLLKGFTRSLFTVFTNLAAGLCAILLARPIVSFFIKLPLIADSFNDMLIGTALEDAAENLLVLVASIASAFAAPALFFILYILLYLILKIPFYLIYKACVKDNEVPNRPFGALVCALNSIIFFIFLFTPLAGYYNTGISVAENFSELPEDSQIAAIFEIEGEPIEVNEIPALDIVYKTGGKAIFTHLSTIEYEDDKVAFSDEITALGKIALNAGLLIEGDASLDIDTKACADELALAFAESVIIKGLAIEGMKVIALEWQNGELDGEWLDSVEEAGFTPVIDELALEYDTCNARMITEDFETIASLLGALSGSELFDALMNSETEIATDELLTLAADETLLYDVLLALYENPRFNGILPELSDIGVAFICKSADIDSTAAPKNPTDMATITKADIKNEASSLSAAFKGLSQTLNSSTTGFTAFTRFSSAISELEDSFLFGHAVDYITAALVKNNVSESLGDFGLSEETVDALSDLITSDSFSSDFLEDYGIDASDFADILNSGFFE